MDALISCPSCGLRGKVPTNKPGTRLTCPGCGVSFVPGKPISESGTIPADGLAIWVDDSGIPPPPADTTAETENQTISKPNLERPLGEDASEATDDAAHQAWLREETKRFDEYVARQLAILDRRRQELAASESKFEAAAVDRERELNRQRLIIAARNEAAARREEAAQAWEADLARSGELLAAREARLAAREARLAGAEGRIVALERREAELRPIVESLQAQYDQLKEQAATLAAERKALELRQADLDRETEALRRREAELDELEEQLRREIEEQERELEHERRMLAAQRKPLSSTGSDTTLPTPRLANDPTDTPG
jgi:DNA repair exonuclease SbcCD ATPase subunit